MYAEHFKEKLKTARLDIGYTQQQITDATGIPRATISRLESGTRQPDLDTLGKLIDFYEINADWFLGTGKKTNR